MKKLLLTLLLTSASMHAMEDNLTQIVDYNLEKHGPRLQQLFLKTFSDADEPDAALINPAAAPNSHVTVLERKSKPIGFAIWDNEKLPMHQAFADVYTDKSSNAMLNVLRLNHLVIQSRYRRTSKRAGKGFGTQLLAHIKKAALDNNDDIIAVSAAFKSPPFYEKNDFIKTIPQTTINFMALPLNKDTRDLLHDVIQKRAENHRKRIGIRVNRYLI
jgi:hypothetical protein